MIIKNFALLNPVEYTYIAIVVKYIPPAAHLWFTQIFTK